ncbi:MAG: hypothetical protein IT335_01070 [Thermomicrobiales bacterium]|nr:hypothetical protein [Thermomicrobiales bacterium]
MPLRVAIDGLAGVGRQIVIAASAGGFSDLFEIVQINEAAGAETVQRRLQRDSVYGRLPQTVELDGETIRLGERSIQVMAPAPDGKVDWEKRGVDIVVVDGGHSDLEDRVAAYREHGAKKVVVAGAPGPDGKTILFGLNDGSYDPDAHHVVGTGSALLNALALPASVIQTNFAIARGAYTVIHPLASGQAPIDSMGSGNLAGRSAWNLVPDLNDRSSVELGEIEPILGSKLFGSVVHAPVAATGWITLSAETERRFELSDAVAAFTDAAQSEQFNGLLGLTSESLVSGDVAGNAHSVTLATGEIAMIGRAFLSVRGWFDADWAIACRTADLLALVCEAGVPGTA